MSTSPEPVHYMARSRAYYEAQGYERPYVWAHFDDVPFTRLRKPLPDLRLALITTAALYPRRASDQREVAWGSTIDAPEVLYGGDLFWDKEATHLEDLNSFFPIDHLRRAVDEGRIGALAPRFYCVPTSYSQRQTLEQDAPRVIGLCKADAVDIALLVPL